MKTILLLARIGAAVSKSGNWLLQNIGAIGMWALLFMGMVLIYEGFDIRDELITSRKNEKAIADGYNKGLDKMNGLLGQIQGEEGVRLSGDTEFTRLFKSRVKTADTRFAQLSEGLNYLLIRAGATPLPSVTPESSPAETPTPP